MISRSYLVSIPALAIEMAGYRVVLARNGREALEWLRLCPPGDVPGVALVDLKMPVMNGRELVEALRAGAVHPHLPVVITAFRDSGALPTAIQGVIAKPPHPATVLDVVRVHCRA